MAKKTLSKLYCRNQDGSINEWSIKAEGNVITTQFGRVGGAIQTTTDIIREGKNIGKKNETSAEEQASKEAKAKWTKQKKSGYVEKIEDAAVGNVDAIIEGGIDPMLAHGFDKHSSKVVYPCFIQPKLDGIRCIATIKNGNVTLWSRTRKPIRSVPHINDALAVRFAGQTVTLDGELYNHDLRNDFEEIVSAVRKDEPAPGNEIVQYHVYDVVIHNASNESRAAWLNANLVVKNDGIVKVDTHVASDKKAVQALHDTFVEHGYEGAIVRNKAGTYVGNRSYNLQKVKTFEDGEFKIVDFEEGRGKLMGHVGAFWCVHGEVKFKAKLKGKTSRLKELFNNPRLWQGKSLTVQYQGFTGDGKPRFPVGKEIRDYE